MCDCVVFYYNRLRFLEILTFLDKNLPVREELFDKIKQHDKKLIERERESVRVRERGGGGKVSL